jgi:hypothetical protein
MKKSRDVKTIKAIGNIKIVDTMVTENNFMTKIEITDEISNKNMNKMEIRDIT